MYPFVGMAPMFALIFSMKAVFALRLLFRKYDDEEERQEDTKTFLLGIGTSGFMWTAWIFARSLYLSPGWRIGIGIAIFVVGSMVFLFLSRKMKK